MRWRSPIAGIGLCGVLLASYAAILDSNAAFAKELAQPAPEGTLKQGAIEAQKPPAPKTPSVEETKPTPMQEAELVACRSNDTRVEKPEMAKALRVLGEASPHSVDIYSPYRFTPAGGETVLYIDRSYADVTNVKGVKNLAVRAIFQLGRDAEPKPVDLFLPVSPIAIEEIPKNDQFAKSVSLPEGMSRLSFEVPAGLAEGGFPPFWWKEGRLTVIGCDGNALKFIGQQSTSYSGWFWSFVAPIVLTGIIYVFAAVAVSLYENTIRVESKQLSWWRCLDPVVLCSGPNSQGSISRLQILFFTVLIFGILTFILLRVGFLSEMSSTVLLLLGISAFGAAAAKAADNSKQRLSLDNWAWLIKKRWLPPHGLASVNIAKWGDLLTGSDGFDIYHFQMLVFSLVVGLALLNIGYTELASFSVPGSLLALLGLSQAVYVTGKVVDQPTVKELDKALNDLRKLEDDFLKAASGEKDLMDFLKAAGGEKDLAEARSKASKEYAAYAKKREEILPMLQAVFVNYEPRDEFFADASHKKPLEPLEPGYPFPVNGNP